MILYFTGTGNSRFVADRLAAQLHDRAVAFNTYMKIGSPVSFRSETPFVFVTPTYMGRMPLEVEDYIRSCTFKGSDTGYFVLTAGVVVAGAEPYCRKLCGEIGLQYQGMASVAMPKNYVALYDVLPKSQARAAAAIAIPAIQSIASSIASRQTLSPRPAMTKGKISTAMVPAFRAVMVHDRAFTVSADCIGCGLCARECPRNNIVLENGHPVWQGRCMHCMACISHCPVRAIDYGKRTRKRNRYYLEP